MWVEGVFPRRGFVEGVLPVAATAGEGVLLDEGAVGAARGNEAFKVEGGSFLIPVIPPVP